MKAPQNRPAPQRAAHPRAPRWLALSPLLLCGALLGCLEDAARLSFKSGLDENLCVGVYNICKDKTAGCVMDEEDYLKGFFPGERTFLVETEQGDWKVRLRVLLEEQVSPGKEFEIRWYEPGCTQMYSYQLSKQVGAGDLFEEAGKERIFEAESTVTEQGDHLITFWSDAVSSYLMKVEFHK